MKITAPAKLRLAKELLQQGIPYPEIKRRIAKKFDTSIGSSTLTRLRKEILLEEKKPNVEDEVRLLTKRLNDLVIRVTELEKGNKK